MSDFGAAFAAAYRLVESGHPEILPVLHAALQTQTRLITDRVGHQRRRARIAAARQRAHPYEQHPDPELVELEQVEPRQLEEAQFLVPNLPQPATPVSEHRPSAQVPAPGAQDDRQRPVVCRTRWASRHGGNFCPRGRQRA